MQQTRSVELGTGLFVLLGLAALFFLTTQTTGNNSLAGGDTYEVTARFENVGSLKVRAPVSMSGVTIGRVTSIVFDPEFLQAKVTFEINDAYDRIPEDTEAAIQTSGMLGSQYIGLTAGFADELLVGGSEIDITHSAIVLENLISKYLFSSGEDDEDD
jgi:phospholipid/cholesterol/gamma-HCH transport system substrate-binding protein